MVTLTLDYKFQFEVKAAEFDTSSFDDAGSKCYYDVMTRFEGSMFRPERHKG